MVLGILILLCVGIGRIRVGIHAAYDGTTATADVTGALRIGRPGKKDKTDEGKAKKRRRQGRKQQKESGPGIWTTKNHSRPSLSVCTGHWRRCACL